MLVRHCISVSVSVLSHYVEAQLNAIDGLIDGMDLMEADV